MSSAGLLSGAASSGDFELTFRAIAFSIRLVQTKRIIKRLSSLKFAVLIILAIATLVAWGTIVEAMYNDAKMAAEMVYHSPISYTIFFLFAVNLTAVIIDRYPWQKHHVGFIAAHIGILILLAGSLVTRYYGVDGSVSIDIGGSSNKITVPETDILVYTTLDGANYKKLHDSEVNFFKNPPSAQKPYVLSLPAGDIKIIEFYPYSLVETKVLPSEDSGDGPAVRFQIANDRITQSEWLVAKKDQTVNVNLGPAKMFLVAGNDFKYEGGNMLVFRPVNDTTISYEVYSDKKKGIINKGQAKAGDQVALGWMNLQLRVLKYLPSAHQEISFKKRDKSSSETISALKMDYNGKERWLGLNSMIRLYGEAEMYVFSYGNRRLPLNFELQLKDFNVGRYQGTMRPASYASRVVIPEANNREVEISMNEPLDYKGYTFYQASFQQDEMGKPTGTVLSVNFDPGRWIKYIGCILIVFGAIHLFYRRWTKSKGKVANA